MKYKNRNLSSDHELQEQEFDYSQNNKELGFDSHLVKPWVQILSSKNRVLRAVCQGSVSEDGDSRSRQPGMLLDHRYSHMDFLQCISAVLEARCPKVDVMLRFRLRSAEQSLLLAWSLHAHYMCNLVLTPEGTC